MSWNSFILNLKSMFFSGKLKLSSVANRDGNKEITFVWTAEQKKSPPKALCDSALPGGKSSGSFLGARICCQEDGSDWRCSQGEGGVWCVLEDPSFPSSLKCCWSWGGNICTNFQGLLPQGTAFDGFTLHFLVCDKGLIWSRGRRQRLRKHNLKT